MTAIEREWSEFDYQHPKSAFSKLVAANHRDLLILSTALIDWYGIPKLMAGPTAMEFTKAFMWREKREKCLSIGVTEAEWITVSSGGNPCDHAALNETRYFVKFGARFKRGFIHPSQLYGCRCISRPIVDFSGKRKGVITRAKYLIQWIYFHITRSGQGQ